VAEKNELTFTVLSDPGNQIATGLGVLTAPTDAAWLPTMQAPAGADRTIGIDLPEANADSGYGVPMPTVVLVDTEGTIRWIDVHPNYMTRTEVSEIIAALDLL
jgi:peroxiredoxin